MNLHAKFDAFIRSVTIISISYPTNVSLCGVIDTCTVLWKRAYMYGLEALHVWQ